MSPTRDENYPTMNVVGRSIQSMIAHPPWAPAKLSPPTFSAAAFASPLSDRTNYPTQSPRRSPIVKRKPVPDSSSPESSHTPVIVTSPSPTPRVSHRPLVETARNVPRYLPDASVAIAPSLAASSMAVADTVSPPPPPLAPRKMSKSKPSYIDVKKTADLAAPLPSALPRTPGGVFQNLFNWKSRDVDPNAEKHTQPSYLNPGATFRQNQPDLTRHHSDLTRHHPSPSASPQQPNPRHTSSFPMSLDISRANAPQFAIFGNNSVKELPTPPVSSGQVAELESELREISSELAYSTKREMELEDEVERLKLPVSDHSPHYSTRRTSDYFSDSGASSRIGTNDDSARFDELEKSRRKAEVEKAQVKLELAAIMKQKRQAEDRLHLLEEHVQSQSRIQTPALTDTERTRQLEYTIEESRRKLDEERRNKASMEELIGGMRHEIEIFKSERDKLRDEVVPLLESRLAALNYFPIDTVAEELTDDHTPYTVRPRIHNRTASARWNSTRPRSNSTVPAGNVGGTRSRSGSISNETRDQLIERAKDLEAHKEAFQRAFRQLLERHKIQEGLYRRRIRVLEQGRSKTPSDTGPYRSNFQSDVRSLRCEVNKLRRRANDALDEKIQTEKGLSLLKSDLNRAKQHSGSMRALLRSHDISVPSSPLGTHSTTLFDQEIHHGSLDKAYGELRTTHALSLAHLKDVGSPQPNTFEYPGESNTILALLKKSLSTAETERDMAHDAAEQYRVKTRQLLEDERAYLSKQADMRTELLAATGKMDSLAEQVYEQLLSNNNLRKRLAAVLERGERDQRTSETQVTELHARLRMLEDQLRVAQSANDAAISSHEEDLRLLKESEHNQLQRSNTAKLSNHSGMSVSGSPLLSGVNSPRLGFNSGRAPKSLNHATGTSQLQSKVNELEKALADAHGEMREVVNRMNLAQMEVAELQTERDEAAKSSRRLQAEVIEQRETVRSLMAKA